jgi:predicted transcriptional regulator
VKEQRKGVWITDTQVTRLNRLANARDEGLSALVRHAVDNFLDSQEASLGLPQAGEEIILDSPVSSTDK